jgi:hypothetical protein
VAIETGLALRLVFHQPLRQTEGAMQSIIGLLGLDLPIPDHTTFSRRGGGLTVLPQRVERTEPLHLLIDSTGVKIYGEGEWLDQKHGVRSRRRWRKLHLAVIGWQRRSGYGRRSLVETAMYRYKTIIGRRLHARTLPNQRTEAKIACYALNRMTSLGMPISVRIK